MSGSFDSFTEVERDQLDRASRTLCIIVVVLIVSALQMAGIILFICKFEQIPKEMPILAWLGLGMAVVCFLAHLVVPRMVVAKGISQLDQEHPEFFVGLLNAMRTKTIMGCALLEGAVFFNLVAYMIDRQWLSLGCAAFLIAAMFVQLPMPGRCESWIVAKRREISERF